MPGRMLALFVLPVALASSTCAGASQSPRLAAGAAGVEACVPDTSTVRWMQEAVSGWASVRAALRLPPGAFPWMVFYDHRCGWHVGGESATVPDAWTLPGRLTAAGLRLDVRAVRHDGRVWLPNGAGPPPTRNVAFASLYRDGAAAFFTVATPANWRREPGTAPDTDVESFFLGVTMHELVHTRHLPLVIQRVRRVAAREGLENLRLDDDVIQNVFGDRPGFREAFEAERDRFYEAALASDAATRRRLLTEALAMATARRARYFTGTDSYYRDFEDIFLAMEGAGQWAAYRFALSRVPGRTPAEAVAVVRDHKYWSQEEGLALFLLLDQTLPDWQSRVFSLDDPGPFALLAEAADAAAVFDATVAPDP